MRNRIQFTGLLAVALVLGGCATAPVDEEEPLYAGENLAFLGNGFLDNRTGWIFPQRLGENLVASQAWELPVGVVGIRYIRVEEDLPVAMAPVNLRPGDIESGAVTVYTYPVGFRIGDYPGTAGLDFVSAQMGFGHGRNAEEEEFWAYQETLEKNGYNLWKLARLVDEDAAARTFHSLLVLKKLSEEKSEGLVVTVGRVDETYLLFVIRRYVRTREDVDAFGDWAYAVLRDLGLVAVRRAG